MSEEKAIATVQHVSTVSAMPDPKEWSMIFDMARALQPTGFLPSGIQTPEQAMAIMLKGRELGLAPMYALSSISIIKGKPTLSAELMLTLVRKTYGPQAIRVQATTNDKCTVQYRDGWGDIQAYTFSMEDAQRAGLAGGDGWRKYPAALLRARCISAVVRMAFPEVIGGAYVPGELGDPVSVTDDGEVQSVGTYDEDTPAGRMAPDRIGRYDPSTDAGVPPHAAASRGYTVEIVDQDTGEIQDDDEARVVAMHDLISVANDHGYTGDDLEVYFDRAGLEPEAVTIQRMSIIAQGIQKNPVAFGETVEKHRAQMQIAQDPELNPSDEQLGR